MSKVFLASFGLVFLIPEKQFVRVLDKYYDMVIPDSEVGLVVEDESTKTPTTN
jgi:hypothetical protein